MSDNIEIVKTGIENGAKDFNLCNVDSLEIRIYLHKNGYIKN